MAGDSHQRNLKLFRIMVLTESGRLFFILPRLQYISGTSLLRLPYLRRHTLWDHRRTNDAVNILCGG